jgi:hypothetical protein
MAKKDKTLEEQIHEAAEAGRIVFMSDDNISDYDTIARDFFNRVFDMSWDDCFVSDESSLSDFAGCGMPEEMADELNIEDYYSAGRAYTVNKIMTEYGIEVDAREYLVDVFEKIRVKATKLVN